MSQATERNLMPWDVRATRTLNVWAAAWMAFLGLIIVIDVTGRAFFSHPIAGVPEVVAASLVGIAFLQLPYAILSGTMLRTTVLRDILGPLARRTVEVAGLLLGAAFFAILVYAEWEPMVTSFATLEYEGGEGFRVPVYPVHAVIMASAIVSALCYARLAYKMLRGEEAAVKPLEF